MGGQNAALIPSEKMRPCLYRLANTRAPLSKVCDSEKRVRVRLRASALISNRPPSTSIPWRPTMSKRMPGRSTMSGWNPTPLRKDGPRFVTRSLA